MASATINLQDFRTPGSKVFTGRDRGAQVRKDSKIDTVANQNESVTIAIPIDIRSINPSFLEEFLVNVVSTLKREGFYQKFHIDNPGQYKIDEDLRDAIDRILRQKNALA